MYFYLRIKMVKKNEKFEFLVSELDVGFGEQVIFYSHCAKVQKYEQGKIGLQFFDMWC